MRAAGIPILRPPPSLPAQGGAIEAVVPAASSRRLCFAWRAAPIASRSSHELRRQILSKHTARRPSCPSCPAPDGSRRQPDCSQTVPGAARRVRPAAAAAAAMVLPWSAQCRGGGRRPAPPPSPSLMNDGVQTVQHSAAAAAAAAEAGPAQDGWCNAGGRAVHCGVRRTGVCMISLLGGGGGLENTGLARGVEMDWQSPYTTGHR